VSNEKEKWFSLEISVDYEGQSLPLDKIWKAWTRGKRYVQLKDGSYTSLPESWLEKIAHKLTALGLDPSKPPQTKFKQFEAPVLDSLLEDLPGARTDSFWNNLREKIRSFREVRPVPPPKALQANLRSYQLQGLSYLNFLSEYGFGGILADEMGLGKTVQTLAFIQHMVESRFEGPNLIVVPTSVLPNWEREAEKFVPGLRRLTIYGTRREGMFISRNRTSSSPPTPCCGVTWRRWRSTSSTPSSWTKPRTSRTPTPSRPAPCAASMPACACACPVRPSKTTCSNCGRCSSS